MDIWKLLLFIPACFALNMAPGPNNLLAMNNARCYGFRAAFVASLGRIAAFSAMIALSASGLAVILYTSEMLFLAIKLVGALYLLWIAFNLWRSESARSLIWTTRATTQGLRSKNLRLPLATRKRFLSLLLSYRNLLMLMPTFKSSSLHLAQLFDFRNGRHFNLCHLWFVLKTLVFKPENGETFQSRVFTLLTVSGVNLLISKQ